MYMLWDSKPQPYIQSRIECQYQARILIPRAIHRFILGFITFVNLSTVAEVAKRCCIQPAIR